MRRLWTNFREMYKKLKYLILNNSRNIGKLLEKPKKHLKKNVLKKLARYYFICKFKEMLEKFNGNFVNISKRSIPIFGKIFDNTVKNNSTYQFFDFLSTITDIQKLNRIKRSHL